MVVDMKGDRDGHSIDPQPGFLSRPAPDCGRTHLSLVEVVTEWIEVYPSENR